MKPLSKLSNDALGRMLEPPSGSVRLVIDTDAKNEIEPMTKPEFA